MGVIGFLVVDTMGATGDELLAYSALLECPVEWVQPLD